LPLFQNKVFLVFIKYHGFEKYLDFKVQWSVYM
jgi:hypothetical protein